MAHEAFALSPMSARAAAPADADFEAIREAFLETARGRWFLDEYTRRNRNADTAMVLEAVARIERSLAAQKEEQQRQAPSEPPAAEAPSSELPPDELPKAMAAVQTIVAAARASAAAALAGPVLEDALAPARKCARVVREIAWGLRESGSDGRICALLDSQVDAINAACDQVMAGGFRDGVLRAFDQAAHEIEGIAPGASQAEAEPVATIHVVDFRPAPEATQTATISDEALSPEAMAEPVVEVAPAAAAPMSTLGESLIASGIVARPASPRGDPLAPIRRMSQAEKVAFFS